MIIESTAQTTFTPCMGATTRYIGPTDHKGSRICVESWRDGGKRRYYSYDYSASCPHQAAFLQWCKDELHDSYAEPAEVAFTSRADSKGFDFLIVRD